MKQFLFILSFLVLCSLISFSGYSPACIQPNNGIDTIANPPVGCDYYGPDDVWMIIDGLRVGSTIEFDGPITDFICCFHGCDLCSIPLPSHTCEGQGGSLGGDGNAF